MAETYFMLERADKSPDGRVLYQEKHTPHLMQAQLIPEPLIDEYHSTFGGKKVKIEDSDPVQYVLVFEE